MANDDEKADKNPANKTGKDPSDDASAVEVRASGAGDESETGGDVAFEGGAPAQLGTVRYVHAAFFAGGALLAFLIGRILAVVWNSLAEWPAAVRAVPQLLRYAEDERFSVTIIVGVVVALALVFYLYRKPHVRQWADEVATELYKVHWPDREVVTNGTIVVLVASVFATVYIGLLDRVWGFITNLVYGA